MNCPKTFFPFVPAASAALLLLASQNAAAFENGVAPFLAGSSGEYIAAMPPIQGLFAIQQTSFTSADRLYGPDGKSLPVPFKQTARSTTTRVLASWGKVGNTNLYSQLVLPLVSLDLSVPGHSGKDKGLANVTVSPVMARWGLSPESSIVAGLDISLRSGSYNVNRTPNVAVGYTSWQPVLAYRYNKPNGFDFGLSNRLMLNQRNSDTDYRSGNGYVGEFTAGWNVGDWKFGVVGAYTNQFSGDKHAGANVGNRTRAFQMGPSIAYNGGPVRISASYQRNLYAVNAAKSNAIWFNVAIPLWVKPGSGH